MSLRRVGTIERSHRRWAVGAVSAVLAMLLSSATAVGKTSVGVFYDEYGDYQVTVTGGRANHDLVLAFRSAHEDYTISDNQRMVAADIGPQRCSVNDAHLASCPRADDGLRAEYAVDLHTYTGDDRVRIDPSVGDRIRIATWSGDDVVGGGPSPDDMVGGDGADVLSSHRANDYLEGDGGKDIYRGGRGNDHIYARDHQHDLVIDCGPGDRDEAWIDKGIDPRPTGCETVHRWT